MAFFWKENNTQRNKTNTMERSLKKSWFNYIREKSETYNNIRMRFITIFGSIM